MGQRQEGTAEEAIYILEECARTRVKGGKIQSQGLTTEMKAVSPEEVSPWKLPGGSGVRVLPGEGKEEA